MNSQGDSSILNKLNSKSKTNKKRMNTDNSKKCPSLSNMFGIFSLTLTNGLQPIENLDFAMIGTSEADTNSGMGLEFYG